MKRIYFLVFVALISIQSAFAGVGCNIDPNNTAFFSPRPDSLPCVERGVSYNQVLQIKIPSSVDLQDFGAPISFVLTVDSVVFDSISGLPAGLDYALNPSSGIFYGDANACGVLYGTTNAPAGNYPLIFHGTMTLHGFPFPPLFDGDTTIDLAMIQSQPQNPFQASVDVIEQGAPCRPVQSGINDFSAELNALLQVYPNPSNGVFNVRIDAGRRLNGEIIVVDVTGRKVYSQAMDVVGLYTNTIDLQQLGSGLYTVQLRTAEGFASKNISIE